MITHHFNHSILEATNNGGNILATLKQQRTRQEIIIAMKQLLNKEAFSDITIKKICETALIHHSTFYRYFEDKYDLLRAVLALICDEINAQLDNGKTVGDATFSIIRQEEGIFHHLQDYQQDGSFYTDFLAGLSTLIFDYATKDKQPTNDALLDVVRRAKYPKLASYTAAGAILGLIAKWNDAVTPASTEELHAFLEDSYAQLTTHLDATTSKSAT